jgi:formylmethanofuran dehydrogenase subunit A
MKYYALEDGKYYITEDMTNGLFPAGSYLIKDHKIEIKNGIYEEEGKLYYYVNNVKQKAGAVKIGDDIYYFSMKYYALEDGKYYITEDMANGLFPAGEYIIKNHKIVIA